MYTYLSNYHPNNYYPTDYWVEISIIVYPSEASPCRTLIIDSENRMYFVESELLDRIYEILFEGRVLGMENEGTISNRTNTIEYEDRNYYVPRCTDGG